MNRFNGKTVVVTGAARGTGEATARRLAAEGAHVLLLDVLDERGEAVAQSLGDRAAFMHADVTQAEDWAAAARDIEERWGRCDALVNNAAILELATVEHQDRAALERVLAVNLVGPFLGIQAFLPLLRAVRGNIVNVGSIDSFSAFAATAAYTSSKFALRGLTKTVALEEAQHGVRCNLVCPGGGNFEMIAESLGRAAFTLPTDLPAGTAGESLPPLGRHAKLDEIAAAIAFFASEDASFCTGTELLVDGGLHAGTLVDVPGIFRSRPS